MGRFSGKSGAMGKGPSQRQLRVGELVRHALADALTRGEVHDKDLEGIVVSVNEVRMSPDLKIATAYVLPLGDGDPQTLVKLLARNARTLRHHVAHAVALKYAPDLRFRADDRVDEAGRIDALLRSPEVMRDLGPLDDDADGED